MIATRTRELAACVVGGLMYVCDKMHIEISRGYTLLHGRYLAKLIVIFSADVLFSLPVDRIYRF